MIRATKKTETNIDLINFFSLLIASGDKESLNEAQNSHQHQILNLALLENMVPYTVYYVTGETVEIKVMSKKVRKGKYRYQKVKCEKKKDAEVDSNCNFLSVYFSHISRKKPSDSLKHTAGRNKYFSVGLERVMVILQHQAYQVEDSIIAVENSY